MSGFFPNPKNVVTARRPLRGDPARALAHARTVLDALGFALESDLDGIQATRAPMNSNKQPALVGAGRLTVRVEGGEIVVASDLSGLRNMRALLFFLPPVMGVGFAVIPLAAGASVGQAIFPLAQGLLGGLLFGGMYFFLKHTVVSALGVFARNVADAGAAA